MRTKLITSFVKDGQNKKECLGIYGNLEDTVESLVREAEADLNANRNVICYSILKETSHNMWMLISKGMVTWSEIEKMYEEEMSREDIKSALLSRVQHL